MYGVEAFVLASSDVGEYDRIYSLLTREFGKVRAVARSVRKPKAKLAGHLDIPNRTWIELVPASKGWQVTQALEQESFPGVRQNRPALALLLANAQFMDAFLHEMRDQKLFGLWERFLLRLTDAPEGDGAIVEFVAAQFKISALSLFGFLPDLTVCSGCEREFPDDHAQLFMHGAWCDACSARQRIQGLRVGVDSLRNAQAAAAGGLSATEACAKDMGAIARHFERQARQYMV